MKQRIVDLPLAQVRPDPDQPRKVFAEEALAELAKSMETQGLLQPIVVRPDGEDLYILIAGERRWRSANRLGWATIPALVRDDITVLDAKKLQLLENITRRDLSPVEEGQAYQRFMEEGLSVKEIADVVGRSTNAIAWKVDMLRARADVLDLVQKGHVTATFAWYVARLSAPMQDVAIPRAARMPYHEACQYLEALWRQEQQMDLLPETKVDDKQREVARKFGSAFERAVEALEELLGEEERKPGLVAGALANELALSETKVRELRRQLERLELVLMKRRVAAAAQQAAG